MTASLRGVIAQGPSLNLAEADLWGLPDDADAAEEYLSGTGDISWPDFSGRLLSHFSIKLMSSLSTVLNVAVGSESSPDFSSNVGRWIDGLDFPS